MVGRFRWGVKAVPTGTAGACSGWCFAPAGQPAGAKQVAGGLSEGNHFYYDLPGLWVEDGKQAGAPLPRWIGSSPP
jgi:hypothetical protein